MNENALEMLKAHIAEYAVGDSTLQSFQEWFIPWAWALAGTGSEAEDLANEVELRLAEFTNGHLSESSLKDALLNYMGNVRRVFFGETALITITGTTSNPGRLTPVDLTWSLSQSADTRSAAVSA
jgi:hypothetical protein